MKIHPYLNFGGQAESAMLLYQRVLGGRLTEIHRFGSIPPGAGFELTPEHKELVMHVGLELPDGQLIMASDRIEGMGPEPVQGNNFSISVHPASREEADRIFNALAEGGSVGMPMADQFWGDYFGDLTDRFGIHWMVNHSEEEPRPE